MSKRFTDTDKWLNDWFLDLPVNYKLAWLYILDNANHAGIFKVNFKILEKMVLEEKIDKDDLLQHLNKDKQRIRVLNNTRWFIEDFLNFQQGKTLNDRNRVHKSIIEELINNGIDLETIKGVVNIKITEIRPQDEVNNGAIDIDIEKDIAKDKDINKKKEENDINLKNQNPDEVFKEAHSLYPGTKRGYETELANLKKKHKDWRNVIPLIQSSIEQEIEYHKKCKSNNVFVPNWKHFKTWINDRCWEQNYNEIILEKNVRGNYEFRKKQQPPTTDSITESYRRNRDRIKAIGDPNSSTDWGEID